MTANDSLGGRRRPRTAEWNRGVELRVARELAALPRHGPGILVLRCVPRCALSLVGAALIVGAGAGLPSAASAQGEADANMQEARQAFESARQLEASGQLAEACARYAESQRRYSWAVTLLNLGNCFESGNAPGGLIEAVRAFERAVAEADAISEPALREPVRAEAGRRLDAARERVPTLVLRRSPTEGARVLLDGAEVGQFGVGLPMNPGPHQLDLSAPGKLAQGREFVLIERRELEIALPELVDAPAAVAAPSTLPVQSAPAATAADTRRFGDLPFLLGGASAALGAAWLFTGLTSRSSDAEARRLRDRCSDEGCDGEVRAQVLEARERARDKARNYARLTDYVVIPAFAATFGTGLVLWWLDGFATSDPSTRPSALRQALGATRAECSRDSCQWQYSGEF